MKFIKTRFLVYRWTLVACASVSSFWLSTFNINHLKRTLFFTRPDLAYSKANLRVSLCFCQSRASGTKDVSLTVPDTITTWETEAFCLSPQGFGLAPRKEITVFQPFFLELTLPYSIIRGEHFELKATTFNYMSSCIMVRMNGTFLHDLNANVSMQNSIMAMAVCWYVWQM